MEHDALSIPADLTQRLRELADRHMVVFEMRPAYQMVDGARVAIGYDLELAGTHSRALLAGQGLHPAPGCEQCQAVWSDLAQLARAVLPPGDRASFYHLEPFNFSLSFDSKRRPTPRIDRPDVVLTVEIRHREGFLGPIDKCEDRCREEIVAALRSLGVQEGTWSELRARLFQQSLAVPPAP